MGEPGLFLYVNKGAGNGNQPRDVDLVWFLAKGEVKVQALSARVFQGRRVRAGTREAVGKGKEGCLLIVSP